MKQKYCHLTPSFDIDTIKEGMLVDFKKRNRKGVTLCQGKGRIDLVYPKLLAVKVETLDSIYLDENSKVQFVMTTEYINFTAKDVYRGKDHLRIIE